MAIEDGVLNFTELISALPPQVVESLDGLIIVLKAVGIAVIAYVAYAIFMGVLSFRRSKSLKLIEKKVISIEKKLNKLLKQKKDKKPKK